MQLCQNLRIIPAYAGQICLNRFADFAIRDHPRIRGTNFSLEDNFTLAPGSSPHTRDKLLIAPMEIRAFGIIPTYAGQIVYIYLETVHFQDHPRIRGTNFSIYHFKGLHTGSSPHTRDKCDVPTGVIIKFGIIPAYAGQM